MSIRNQDKNFLKICFEAAKENETAGNARLAACIVYKNKIVSIGYNQMKTDPLQAQYSKNDDAIFLHAEIHAIKNFLRISDQEKLKKSTLYISRAITDPRRRKWKEANSTPCAGCTRAIVDFGIGRVVCLNEDGKAYEYPERS